jgi:hypothetical protein
MATIVVIWAGGLALLGIVLLISECLQVESRLAPTPGQIDCDSVLGRTATHSAPSTTAPTTAQ